MFRKNRAHHQATLLDSTLWMDPGIRDKLAKSWAPIFYEHVFCQIDEQPFSVLYSNTGAPNFPVNILVSLEYIKHIRDCNDLELVDSFHFDYLVNYALGIRTLGELNLADRTLYNFRQRVYQYSQEHPGGDDLLFGQFLRLLEGFVRVAGVHLEEQRTDTTMFMSNIKKAGRISLAFDVLTSTVSAIPEALRPETLQRLLEPAFRTDVLYRSRSQDGDTRLAKLLNLCREAVALLETLPAKKGVAAAIAVARRFLEEQSVVDAETGGLSARNKKEIPSGSLQSAYDADATYRHKGEVRQSGYVLSLAETCDTDNPIQLLTDYAVAPNNVNDAEILSGRLPMIKQTTGCTDLYADGGYHSEGVNGVAAEHGVNIHLTDMTGTEPSTKMPVTAFDIDPTSKRILQCPAGHTPVHAGVGKNQTSAHFPTNACSTCPLRSTCHSRPQRKDWVVRINLKAIRNAAIREEIHKDRKENTSKRAAIESANAALKRKGLRKLPVRNRIRCSVYCAYKVTAQNIKRIVRYCQGEKSGRTSRRAPSVSTIQGIIIPICG